MAYSRQAASAGAEQNEASPELNAVVAHGVLNSLGVVLGSVHTLREHWGELATQPELAREIMDRIECQAAAGAELLRDLLRGVPPGLLVELAGDRVIRLP